jgi:hypothetical protein
MEGEGASMFSQELAMRIDFILYLPIGLRFRFKLRSHLQLILPSGLLPPGFTTTMLHAFLLPITRHTHLFFLIL